MRVYTLIIIALIGCLLMFQPVSESSLAKTAVDNQIFGPDKPKNIDNSPKEPECEGMWVDSPATNKVNLNAIYLKDWGAKTSPSLILDTYNSVKNYVIIGHNVCVNNNCYAPNSQFGNIINSKIGDKVTACLGEVLYSGYIFKSEAVPDTKVEIMGDWTGFKTVTMFTSYGECKDSACSSTKQRWMVAFERNK